MILALRALAHDPYLFISWSILKYPIPKDRRIKLARLYFYLGITPGLPTQIVAICADGFKVLTRSKHKITIEDMRLPWKPIYDILSQDLFLKRRQFEYTYVSIICFKRSLVNFLDVSQLSWCMGYIAENSRKFFHPAAIDEMLETFLPQLDGTKLDVSLFIIHRDGSELTPQSDHSLYSVLSRDFPTSDPPQKLSSHVVPLVGVNKLLHV